jgi:beta-lactamase class D
MKSPTLAILLCFIATPALAAAPAPMDIGSAEAQTLVAGLLDGFDGCFVLHDSVDDRFLVHNPERCARPFPPCSTFKIPNSLIALELGVLADADHVIPWDPVQDPKQDWWSGPVLGEWPRDHDLRSAMKNSVVWYYQEVARRIRAERMQAHLERIGYGNRDISGGIDRFWLGSSLKVSADEQVAFLILMKKRRLGFSERSTAIVESIIERERGDGWVLRAKTGGGPLDSGRRIGWLVGWVERGDRIFTFALNLEGDTFEDVWKPRVELPGKILRALDIIPPEQP